MSGISNWDNAIASLKNKARNFNTVFDRVIATEQTAKGNPELARDFDSLVYKGDIVRSTITNVTKAIDQVTGVGRSILGNIPPENLGALPLVPIAVIFSASAAITYWVKDAMQYLDKVDRIEQLKNEGLSTTEAYSMVNNKINWNIVIPLSLAAIIFIPQLMNRKPR